MGTEAPSTIVWLLWTLLLWTLGCRCPRISLHQYLWGKTPVVQFLGRRVAVFLTLWGTSTQFFRLTVPVHIPTNSARGFPFLHIPFQRFSLTALLIFTILTGVRWYLIVVFICISLMTSDVEHFLMCLLVYVFFGEVSIHVFWLDCVFLCCCVW